MGTDVLYCDYGAGCTTVYSYQNSSNAASNGWISLFVNYTATKLTLKKKNRNQYCLLGKREQRCAHALQ